jgi:DNA repair protein RecO (recombination protein O)
MSSRTQRSEAVVLRSLRYGEADRILHVFTKDRGRLGAIAKGARRTRSRFGALLEPFTHVELLLHHGRGELATVTGVDLVRSHQSLAGSPYRIAVGSIGMEAVSRLFIEHDANPKVFHALVRFLDVLDEPAKETSATRPGSVDETNADPRLDPLALSLQLKLLWLAGYLPHLESCASCGRSAPLVAFSAAAGGGVCSDCMAGASPVSAKGLDAVRMFLELPLAGAGSVGVSPRAARDALAVIESVYEFHGGFRLRTLARRA